MAVVFAFGPASPVFAGETKDILERECKKRLVEMSSSACACIGDKAEAGLSANEQQMVITMMKQDQAAAAGLIRQLTLEEMQKAAAFMASVPMACAKGG
ncbi:MAG: hypothetical protein ACE5FM_04190 [Methyloligellaceae bacterium]